MDLQVLNCWVTAESHEGSSHCMAWTVPAPAGRVPVHWGTHCNGVPTQGAELERKKNKNHIIRL